MELNFIKNSDVTIVEIDGRIDTVTAPELEKQIAPLWEEKGVSVVFNCEKMSYISSSGLRVILTAYKKITANEGKFAIENLNKEVKTVFDLTGFSRILTIR